MAGGPVRGPDHGIAHGHIDGPEATGLGPNRYGKGRTERAQSRIHRSDLQAPDVQRQPPTTLAPQTAAGPVLCFQHHDICARRLQVEGGLQACQTCTNNNHIGQCGHGGTTGRGQTHTEPRANQGPPGPGRNMVRHPSSAKAESCSGVPVLAIRALRR